MNIKQILRLLAFATFFSFFFLLIPAKAFAGCATGLKSCDAPFVTCSSAQTVYCCGDGISTAVGNQECATLNAQPATQVLPGGAAGIGTPGQLMGQFNHVIFGTGFREDFYTPRGIISYLLPYLFTFAGLILFVMIIWGGFEMLTGATDPKQQEAGKQRLTAGIIGFLLIFSAYWIAQLVQTIFGISILK